MIHIERVLRWRKAAGMVLLLAMVFLLLLSLLAGNAMRATDLAFRLAGNAQFREQAEEYAESIVTEIASAPANFPLSVSAGESICQPGAAEADGCSGVLPVPPATPGAIPAGVRVSYRVTRRRPHWLGRLPRRLEESTASSSRVYRAAVFEASAEVDGSGVRLGSAVVAQGFAVLVPRGGQP